MVAEWLRRLTRNQLGSARTGSNPVHCDEILLFVDFFPTINNGGRKDPFTCQAVLDQELLRVKFVFSLAFSRFEDV